MKMDSIDETTWLVCDSLLSEHFPEYGFDIVVGNPPWGRVKLSLHSFVNGMEGNYHVYGTQYGDFDKERFIAKKQDALSYSKFLKERYPLLGDAEPDMYMAFLQKAISVLRAGGHLSYIVPAGLIRSLGTKSLRKFLINCSEDLKYYLLDNRANYINKTHPTKKRHPLKNFSSFPRRPVVYVCTARRRRHEQDPDSPV